MFPSKKALFPPNTIELACGTQVVSSITSTSAKSLNLEVGKNAYAVIKASNVIVGTDN